MNGKTILKWYLCEENTAWYIPVYMSHRFRYCAKFVKLIPVFKNISEWYIAQLYKFS